MTNASQCMIWLTSWLVTSQSIIIYLDTRDVSTETMQGKIIPKMLDTRLIVSLGTNRQTQELSKKIYIYVPVSQKTLCTLYSFHFHFSFGVWASAKILSKALVPLTGGQKTSHFLGVNHWLFIMDTVPPSFSPNWITEYMLVLLYYYNEIKESTAQSRTRHSHRANEKGDIIKSKCHNFVPFQLLMF